MLTLDPIAVLQANKLNKDKKRKRRYEHLMRKIKQVEEFLKHFLILYFRKLVEETTKFN